MHVQDASALGVDGAVVGVHPAGLGKADDERRAIGLGGEARDLRVGERPRDVLADVPQRVAGQRELGEHDDVGGSRTRRGERLPDAAGVLCDVAQGAVDLGERQSHDLAPRCAAVGRHHILSAYSWFSARRLESVPRA
jgi:hypothetical protein